MTATSSAVTGLGAGVTPAAAAEDRALPEPGAGGGISTPLTPGQRLPWVELPTAAGATLRLSAYRGRANLALFILPAGADGPARAWLTAVAEQMAGYRERHSQPLAILGGPLSASQALWTELALPFPLLGDQEGRVLRALAPHDAAGQLLPLVLLTDRYGEVRVHLPGLPVSPAAQQAEIFEWLMYIDCLCSC